MKVVLDIEANGLENPTQVWLVVCKNIETGELHVFRNLTSNEEEKRKFIEFCSNVSLFIGHNILEFDYPVLNRLVGLVVEDIASKSIDTLLVSRMVDYSREGGHSLAQYGEEFGLPKIDFEDWSKWSQEMETYCIRDVEINHKVYSKYLRYINNPERRPSIILENRFQEIVNDLHHNGFAFNKVKARKMLDKVEEELKELDDKILKAFPPKLKFVREVTPRATKFGTISKSSIPRSLGSDLSVFSEGASFCLCEWKTFNPASHKQIVEVLNEAGWQPEERTQTHIDTEREVTKLSRDVQRDKSLDISLQAAKIKLEQLKKSGWKVNEKNLATLPSKAPAPARLLAKRILLEARRRTLTEWLDLVQDDDRIHGRFYGIGAWTHRMAHQQPNTANIPNEFDTAGNKKLLGKEMRALWCAPKNRLLVGVDAEGIQLRIFAHYIDDAEFTKALVEGKKDDKTDPHSLNQRIIGSICKSRAAAKRFIYAMLLGAGLTKLGQILECDGSQAQEALDRLAERYTGFATLKQEHIPHDAKRGWFLGLDGRGVRIPGDTLGARKHLAMSGYLQNGEAVCMKHATLKWAHKLKEFGAKLVNFVHDEWQVECPNDVSIAKQIALMMADSLREVGEELKLKCPLAGSYWNDDLKDYTIGTNWSVTH